jgi:F-type H+-transporting ATPase subunit epsilon
MQDKNLQLEVTTPTRTFFKQLIKQFRFRAVDGEMTILPNHAPIMTIADIGIMHITDLEGKVLDATLFGGTVLVENNKILVVTEDALWPEEVDVERAELSRKKAQEILSSSKRGRQEFVTAEHRLRRALARIDLANTYEGIRRHQNY